MGINGLWELVKPAARIQPLTFLAIEHACARKVGVEPYRVGVDASIWLHAAQHVHITGHVYRGQSPELNTVFTRLARLSRLPLTAIIVFDGPERPSIKRGKKVLTREDWMVQAVLRFVTAFGFQYHFAPGEAEAELAEMSARGLIDAVLTDDSDALVFGARMIIRNPVIKKDKDNITFYTREAIQDQVSSGLTRGGYVLVALMSGGDYDQEGLPGFGPRIASGIARYGCGDALLVAASLPSTEVKPFLTAWRAELRRYVRDDPNGYIGRRSPALASKIPDSFPSFTVLTAYVSPVTSFSSHVGTPPPCRTSPPDLAGLAKLCERYFTWGSTHGILDKFARYVWPGVALRLLYADLEVNMISVASPTRASNQLSKISPTAIVASKTSKALNISMFKARFPAGPLRRATLVSPSSLPLSEPDLLQHVDFWLSAEVLSRCCPVLSQEYAASKQPPSGRKRKRGYARILAERGTVLKARRQDVLEGASNPGGDVPCPVTHEPIYISDSQSDDVSMFPSWVIEHWREANASAKCRAAVISASNAEHSPQRLVQSPTPQRTRRELQPFPMDLFADGSRAKPFLI